jgi:hypothetical protein
VLAAALALLAGGCGGSVESLSFPNAPTTVTTAPTAPTLPGNLSSIGEGAVPGVTTTTAPRIGPGHATLNGTVFGPNGPVAGATVWADRFVGDEVSSAHTTSKADGSWTIANVLGGRFRVRAWQPPSLDLITPQVVFLGSTQTLTMSLQLATFKGPSVATSVSPSVPQVGQPANLVVQVTNPAVGTDGVVTYAPDVKVRVTLVNGPNWVADNGNPNTTDAYGDVLFQVTCTSAGSNPLSAAVGSAPSVPLQMPACAGPPPTTTTNPFGPCPTTTVPGGGAPNEPTTTTTLAFGSCG